MSERMIEKACEDVERDPAEAFNRVIDVILEGK